VVYNKITKNGTRKSHLKVMNVETMGCSRESSASIAPFKSSMLATRASNREACPCNMLSRQFEWHALRRQLTLRSAASFAVCSDWPRRMSCRQLRCTESFATGPTEPSKKLAICSSPDTTAYHIHARLLQIDVYQASRAATEQKLSKEAAHSWYAELRNWKNGE
jgi:hypothetical protein